MKPASTFPGSVSFVSGHFLVGGCADLASQIECGALSSRGTCREGKMEAILPTAHVAGRNAGQAREAMDRMYRSGLRK